MRILIAEDEEGIRDLLGDLLCGAGHEVGFAASFPAAERMMTAQHWDVMMADRSMPGGDGMALAEAAAARGMGALLCTGHPESADALRARGIHYIQKPFTFDKLLATIEAAV